ncbi:MAG: hypothetical protein ABWZ80_00275 [Beijerinckiaceae bacterium]
MRHDFVVDDEDEPRERRNALSGLRSPTGGTFAPLYWRDPDTTPRRARREPAREVLRPIRLSRRYAPGVVLFAAAVVAATLLFRHAP